MMKKLILLLLLPFSVFGQTFTHSGLIRTENNIGVPGIAVRLYKRTTPVLTGFTSQTREMLYRLGFKSFNLICGLQNSSRILINDFPIKISNIMILWIMFRYNFSS